MLEHQDRQRQRLYRGCSPGILLLHRHGIARTLRKQLLPTQKPHADCHGMTGTRPLQAHCARLWARAKLRHCDSSNIQPSPLSPDADSLLCSRGSLCN